MDEIDKEAAVLINPLYVLQLTYFFSSISFFQDFQKTKEMQQQHSTSTRLVLFMCFSYCWKHWAIVRSPQTEWCQTCKYWGCRYRNELLGFIGGKLWISTNSDAAFVPFCCCGFDVNRARIRVRCISTSEQKPGGFTTYAERPLYSVYSIMKLPRVKTCKPTVE